MAELKWCDFCSSRHTGDLDCPGDLSATDTERHGWRTHVQTPHGMEAYGVLVAACAAGFRARILTFPNVLWLAPGTRGSMKFVGATPGEAEEKAIAFVRAHCRQKGYRICDEPILAWNDPMMAVQPDNSVQRVQGPQQLRKITFAPIRFGPFRPTIRAGTGNVSETGLFIVTELPTHTGARLHMRLDLETFGIPLVGEVCWNRQAPEEGRAPGMGVRLTLPPEAYRRYVQSLP